MRPAAKAAKKSAKGSKSADGTRSAQGTKSAKSRSSASRPNRANSQNSANTPPADLEIRAFPTPAAFARWLARHHADSAGLWLRFYKKDSGVKTITYAEALDEALCWGWIDGQTKSYDAASWLQRFTPRRARSLWSKRNRDHVARLDREGRMQSPGRAQVDAAMADGRWERAYDSPANTNVPDDFMAALSKHPNALAFFRTLKRVQHYAIAYRLHDARKPETRQRRFELFLQRLIDGKPIV